MFKKHQKASNSLKRLEFRLFLTSTVGLISMDRWTENCCSCRSRREKSLKQPCLKIHIWSIVIPSKDGWTADANLAHLNHVSAKPMGLQCSIVMQSLYSYCIVSSCFIAYVWHCLQRTSSSLSSNCRRTVVELSSNCRLCLASSICCFDLCTCVPLNFHTKVWPKHGAAGHFPIALVEDSKIKTCRGATALSNMGNNWALLGAQARCILFITF